MSLQLKYKKLKYKIKYLTAEKNEVHELIQIALPKFEHEFRRQVPKYDDGEKKQKKVTIEKSKIPTTKENRSVKKVYRRICTQTHPDKLEQLPNNKLKKSLIEKYKVAVNSYKNNDIVSLFDIADELDINLPEIDEPHITMMMKQTEVLKEKINTYRKSNAYIWYTSENKEQTMNKIIDALREAGRI